MKIKTINSDRSHCTLGQITMRVNAAVQDSMKMHNWAPTYIRCSFEEYAWLRQQGSDVVRVRTDWPPEFMGLRLYATDAAEPHTWEVL